MAWPSLNHVDGGLYGAGAEPVQGLLARLRSPRRSASARRVFIGCCNSHSGAVAPARTPAMQKWAFDAVRTGEFGSWTA
jgi:hypothetical protein